MLRRFCCFIVLGAVGVSLHMRAEARQPTGRAVLLIVDDLHLDFRSTPRLRELAARLVRPIIREGNLCGLVSTGTSGVSVTPTIDAAALDLAITRLVGNGLKLSETFATAFAANVEREQRARAIGAFSTAADAIDTAAASHAGRPLSVLYVSGGYDNGVVFEADRLVQSARRAKVAVNTIELRGVVNAAAPQGISQADWDVHVAVMKGSLSALASQTQGVAAFRADDVDVLLSRIAQPGR